MNIKVVILSHNTPKTTKALYDLLHDYFDVTVFNVGSGEMMSPACPYELYPNLFYTECWRESMRRFTESDVLWVIGGDVVAQNSALQYRMSIESSMPFGLWSPSFDGYSREVMSKKIAEGKVYNVFHLEGIAMAMSRQMLNEIENEIPQGNMLGWGVDIWMAWRSWKRNKRNILDGRVSMFHPEKCGYSRTDAKDEMVDFLQQTMGDNWIEEGRMTIDLGHFNNNIREVING